MRSYSASERRLNSPDEAFVDAAGFRRGQQAQHVLNALLNQEQAG